MTTINASITLNPIELNILDQIYFIKGETSMKTINVSTEHLNHVNFLVKCGLLYKRFDCKVNDYIYGINYENPFIKEKYPPILDDFNEVENISISFDNETEIVFTLKNQEKIYTDEKNLEEYFLPKDKLILKQFRTTISKLRKHQNDTPRNKT